MNFDRNTVIGFVILALLFMGYFYWNSREQALLQKEKARQDSIALSHQPKQDPLALKKDSLSADSIRNKVDTSLPETRGTENLSIVENDLIRIAFTNKGGQ